VLNYPNYIFERWHGTLLVWAVMIFSFTVNVYGIKILPVIQLVGGICHVIFFVALIIPLVLLSPRSTAEFVFTETLSNGGWSDGLSWCIGLLTVTYCFLGKSSHILEIHSKILINPGSRFRRCNPHERRSSQRPNSCSQNIGPDYCYQWRTCFYIRPRPLVLHRRHPGSHKFANWVSYYPDILPGHWVCKSFDCHDGLNNVNWHGFKYWSCCVSVSFDLGFCT
jgi:hypothetical protein